MISKRWVLVLGLLVLAFAALWWGLWKFGVGSDAPGAESRHARLLDPDLADVDTLIFERNSVYVECRRVDGDWRLISPIDVRADAARMAQLLDALEQNEILDQVSVEDMRQRDLTLGDFGLAPPGARLVLSTSARRIEILFGRRLPLGGQIFVSKPPFPEVLLVPESILDGWPAAADDLRDRRLIPGDPAAVWQMEVRMPGAPFVQLLRDGRRWQLSQPVALRADFEVVSQWLTNIFALRAERFVWPRESVSPSASPQSVRDRLVAYGLDRDEGVLLIQMRKRGDPIGTQIRIGIQSRGDSGMHTAFWSGDNSMIEIASAHLPGLMPNPLSLRDRRPFDIPAALILAIEWRRGLDRVRLIREDPLSRWHLESPLVEMADHALVQARLVELLALRADDFLDTAEPLRADSGNGLLSLHLSDGQTSQVLHLWPSGSNTWDGVLEGRTAGFRFQSETIPAWLRESPFATDFRDRSMISLFEPAMRTLRVRANDAESLKIVRAPDGRWTAPLAFPSVLDTDALENLLLQLANFRACSRADPAILENPAAPFRTPILEIEIETDEHVGQPVELALGASAPGGGRYARVSSRREVFVLDDPVVEVLLAPLVRRMDAEP